MNEATGILDAGRARLRALPRLAGGLFAKPALSGQVKRGYAVGLFWTISDSDRAEAVEGIAEQYDRDLVVVAGPLDADGRSTLVGLANSVDVGAGERPLAWCVSHARAGSWIGAYAARGGTWWTVVVKDGRLLAGPITDRIHESKRAAETAVAAEIADAAENGETIDGVFGSEGFAVAGVPFAAETVDDALALAVEARKRASGRGGARRTGWPRLRRTKASEHLRKRIAVAAAILAALAVAWWIVSSLVSRSDVRNAVAPPPPPPPPPPWISTLQRLPAPVWAESCRRQTDTLAREIAGWSLVARECTESMALVRWERRGAAYPIGTVESFERAFAASDPRAGLSIEFARQGNVGTASLPMMTLARRQATPPLVPQLGAAAIERRMYRIGQANAMRIEMRPRVQLQPRPNDKRPYWSVGFIGDLPAGASLSDWARAFDVPGLALKDAKWEARTLQWSVSGEVYERN